MKYRILTLYRVLEDFTTDFYGQEYSFKKGQVFRFFRPNKEIKEKVKKLEDRFLVEAIDGKDVDAKAILVIYRTKNV